MPVVGNEREASPIKFEGEGEISKVVESLESMSDSDVFIENSKGIDVHNEIEPLTNMPDLPENIYEGESIQNTTNDKEGELDQLSLEERSTLMAEEAEQILRESFWEGAVEDTLEETQEVPLTVPESAREQALEEISWQAPSEDSQGKLSQEDVFLTSEAERQTENQGDLPKKNTLKTALELMEERFSIKEKADVESENKE